MLSFIFINKLYFNWLGLEKELDNKNKLNKIININFKTSILPLVSLKLGLIKKQKYTNTNKDKVMYKA